MSRFLTLREAFQEVFGSRVSSSSYRVFSASGYYYVVHIDDVAEFLDERRHFSDFVEEVI